MSKPNKRVIVIEAMLLLLVLAMVDYTFRADIILLNPRKYLAVLGAVFLFIVVLRLVVSVVPWRPARWLLSISLGAALGLTYGVDYNYFSTYGRFMGPHEFSMLIGEFGYWQSNINNLFSNEELFSLVLYSLPFLLVFGGIIRWALVKRWPGVFNSTPLPVADDSIRPASKNLFGRILNARVFYILLCLVAMIGALKVVKFKQARFLLTPEFATYYGVREFFRNPETFKIKPPRIAYPERKGDPNAIIVNQRKPNIVFMLFESINMRHTSMSDYARDTTPNLKSYIEDAYQFSGVANSTTTTFSTTSLFSGFDYREIEINDTLDYPLLWWYTKHAGYKNHVFTSQWLRYRSKGDYFIDRKRTDTLKEPLYSSRSLGRDDHVTIDILNKELPNIKSDEGMFLYINFAGTHFPYRVGQDHQKWNPTRENGFHRKYLHLTINQYDNALLYFDAAFKKAMDTLEENNILDNSIVILASDHGEGMMEHGLWGHGPVFYQEGIEAPIYIKIGQNVRGILSEQELEALNKNQSHLVSNVDIFKTVLDIVGIDTTKDLSGKSLLQSYPPTVIVNNRAKKSYMVLQSHSGFKLIVTNKNHTVLCMNIKSDPDELDTSRFTLENDLNIPEAEKMVVDMQSCDLPYQKL